MEAVEALGPRILHVHARDGVRDLARGRGLEVPLGRGSADFPGLLGALENFSYRGYFTIAREAIQPDEAEAESGPGDRVSEGRGGLTAFDALTGDSPRLVEMAAAVG